jgi:hypothetical protein
MRPMSILYALWCLAVVALFATATARSYSPFADGGPRTFVSGVGTRGPTHK